MFYTVLLKAILEKADEVKKEFNGKYLCASHIAVAVADFCETEYTGFSLSDSTYHPSRFEEERLRYIFSKTVAAASHFRRRLSYNTRNGVFEEEFDIASCENIASLRGADVLASDIVFLCALKELQKQHRTATVSVVSDDSIIELLQETDRNIYDFVISSIENVCRELKKKSDEAVALRDWMPAAKFAEPNELADLFFEKTGKQIFSNLITLKFPKFFGTADLKVSIHKEGRIYYVHDNGCAIKHLSNRTGDKQKCERALKRVCHSCWISKGRITGNFTNAFRFLYYLQMLVFVAHADLYYTKAKRPLYDGDKDYVYSGTDKAEPIDETVLFDELKKGINFNYHENEGLYCWLLTKYSLYSDCASFLIETLENGRIRISDRRKGKIEGEIFEGFYCCNDDIAPYGKFISKIASRFGAEFDGKDVYLTDKSENFYKAIFKFFNLAVLLSEFGHDIALPKIKGNR